MAGPGKTALLAQWLEECPQPSAWLSLDEHDNDLTILMSYLIAAVWTLFPGACTIKQVVADISGSLIEDDESRVRMLMAQQ